MGEKQRIIKGRFNELSIGKRYVKIAKQIEMNRRKLTILKMSTRYSFLNVICNEKPITAIAIIGFALPIVSKKGGKKEGSLIDIKLNINMIKYVQTGIE